VATTQQLGLQ